MQPMNEMTREQAISKLQEERDLLEGEVDIDGSDWCADMRQALEMGIEALRAADIEPDDLCLIRRFGMTRKSIARVMWNAMRTVCNEVEQFAYALASDHDTLDDIVDGGLWDDDGNLKWIAYRNEVAFAIFQDIISWNTPYGGSTSAIEACRMAGIDGFKPLRKEK